MFYPTLRQAINFIVNNHIMFAETPWKDEMVDIIRNTRDKIINTPALVGITYRAITDGSHGEISVLITIEKVIVNPDDKSISAGWEITVVRDPEEA